MKTTTPSWTAVTVFTPSMILDARIAFTRYTEAAERRHVYGFDATSVGFPASFSAARPDPIPPRLSIEQYGDVGTATSATTSAT